MSQWIHLYCVSDNLYIKKERIKNEEIEMSFLLCKTLKEYMLEQIKFSSLKLGLQVHFAWTQNCK